MRAAERRPRPASGATRLRGRRICPARGGPWWLVAGGGPPRSTHQEAGGRALPVTAACRIYHLSLITWSWEPAGCPGAGRAGSRSAGSIGARGPGGGLRFFFNPQRGEACSTALPHDTRPKTQGPRPGEAPDWLKLSLATFTVYSSQQRSPPLLSKRQFLLQEVRHRAERWVVVR
jgi:hypothetical protein